MIKKNDKNSRLKGSRCHSSCLLIYDNGCIYLAWERENNKHDTDHPFSPTWFKTNINH